MGSSGLSSARLRRMHDVLAGQVDQGVLPGLVTVVSRHGEAAVDAIGAQAFGGTPMRRDTIFRISSMTKPVVAAAAMILVEECRLRLDDPVDPLLPELADRRVLVSVDGPLDDTVPAARPITLRDLLTFRPGIGLLMDELPDEPPILAAMTERSVAVGPPQPAAKPGDDEFLRRLGELPLMFQPGERWQYHTSAEVLGVLVARAAGQPLETFLRDRLFGPLGMVDTAFSVPADRIDRLAASYLGDLPAGDLMLWDAPDGQWATPPAFQSGTDGLVSTADDFLAFGTMLLRHGRHGGEQVLSRRSVELMTADQLAPGQAERSGFPDLQGWGFGMSVTLHRDAVSATPGQYGWAGGLGTGWYSDPAEDMVTILLTQRAVFPLPSPTYQDFFTLAYQAIDD
ncbi:MAG TPA: serine hydrolase domain-containing protein [Pseudonocardiaceae bacterium]|nr:serine hydrolase domain-containing protein [Pseudonocardiaceae bacterium]